LRVVLAAAILAAGVPVHGSIDFMADLSPPAPAMAISHHERNESSALEGGCPHSAVSSDKQTDPPCSSTCPEVAGHCATDCGCHCAGLSLVIPMKTANPPGARLPSHPVKLLPLLGSAPTDPLLRPPQA